MEYSNLGLRGFNPKRCNIGRPEEKGKQLMSWQNKPLCRTCGKLHSGQCTLETMRCYRCGEMGHKMNNCPKATWNREKAAQVIGPRNPPTPAPRGRPPATGPALANKSFKKPQAGEECTI